MNYKKLQQLNVLHDINLNPHNTIEVQYENFKINWCWCFGRLFI